jgi:hypothetical protein
MGPYAIYDRRPVGRFLELQKKEGLDNFEG